MAASYADGFRLIKEKPCKHAAGFLKGNQPPRNKRYLLGIKHKNTMLQV
jgi:hypothetical protein